MAAAEVCTVPPQEVPVFDKADSAVVRLEAESPKRQGWIVQSPYQEPEHQLDLSSLDFENAVLAEALKVLQAVRGDYATAPYNESFNWQEVIAELRRVVHQSGGRFKESSFYVVAFRSRIKPSTDYSHLGDLDKAAHAEAVASGGFLK